MDGYFCTFRQTLLIAHFNILYCEIKCIGNQEEKKEGVTVELAD